VEEYSQNASTEHWDEDLDEILEEDRLTPTNIVESSKGFVLYEESIGLVRFRGDTVKGFIESELEGKLDQIFRFTPQIRLAKTLLNLPWIECV
jgi:hypothetical protein